jgi:hypothetical protein
MVVHDVHYSVIYACNGHCTYNVTVNELHMSIYVMEFECEVHCNSWVGNYFFSFLLFSFFLCYGHICCMH